MSSLGAIFWKELADNFGSRRFLIMVLLICLIGLFTAYLSGQVLKTKPLETSTEFLFLRLFTSPTQSLPSFTSFLGLFGSLLGIIFGFDAINSEQSAGTMSLVLSQPVFRDSLINGKFLAGLATIAVIFLSIILIVFGLELRMFGILPEGIELARLALFLAISVIYAGFWVSLGILFSILFRHTTTSMLTSIAAWFFFTFFIYMVANVIADQIAPITQKATEEMILKHTQIQNIILRASPGTLYGEAVNVVLNPSVRTLGLVFSQEIQEIIPAPLSISQSLMIIWPQLVALMVLMLVCFAISYVIFMKREIRST